MSADNGIYILVTRDGFYIDHLQAIENLHWNDKKKEHTAELNQSMVYTMFRNAKVVHSEQKALDVAMKMHQEIMNDDCGIIEYGIQTIFGWQDRYFPTSCCENQIVMVNTEGDSICGNCGAYL